MSDHDSHGEHGGHDVHLPDPSPWPLVVGAAAMLLGLALVWWSRDRHNAITGPFLGAAAVFALISAAGWAYEDGRMRKKAEEGSLKTRKAPRYTQVITFAIAEGQAGAARAADGVLSALEASESVVKDLAGFQDYRVTVSPATAGPVQVLAETTWSDRQGLTTYDAAQKTLLDVINAHNDEIVVGSVQAFDMEVVRDTKEPGFVLSRGSLVALLGSFILGGFMIGAGLNLFASDKPAASGGGGGEPTAGPAADPFNVTVDAKDNLFAEKELTAAADSDIKVTFNNKGRVKHNVHFLTAKGGETLADGAKGEILDGGGSEVLSFHTVAAGDYYYQCDLHPDQMTGVLHLVPAPAGGSAGTAGGGAAASPAAAK